MDTRECTPTKLKILAGFLSASGQRVLIQMHNSPDPDSIASAFGLQYLLKSEGIDAIICYRGEIEKYSTNRLVELLNIQLMNIRDIHDMKEEDYIILVDSQKGNSNITDLIGNEIASIDHHPAFHEYQYLFEDIRPNVGACASIIAEYFCDNQITIPQRIATALLYGIKTDTLDLSRGVSELDLDMFCMLYKISDIDLLNQIQLNQLQFCELTAYSNAIKNIKVYDKIGFAYLGVDCPDSLLGTVSDFIISLKEVEFSVVYSERKAGVKFSLRNETSCYDAGKVIMEALGGLGSGGGHKTMAGGFIPVSAMEDMNHSFHSFIENRFLDILRLSRELQVPT
jgi:nanoRNase/pAp phosphatase (c-di-AMP/oligoRNAs hydrolase)